VVDWTGLGWAGLGWDGMVLWFYPGLEQIRSGSGSDDGEKEKKKNNAKLKEKN
jgi:hypothetical protein